ncbi:MAG TPA: HAMP domain-containing protein [Bacteroidaceae bacterium]|nr:HAMP domain-containing protein [Bacteroidaceae bacterium]
MLKFIRTHLASKLFISYVVIVMVGVLVLVTAASLSVPSAFERHLSQMSRKMGNSQSMEIDFFTNYSIAVSEAVSLAATVALIAAIIASFFVSRQVVTPIQKMMKLSHCIAEGEYEERLSIPGRLQSDQVDELGQLALSFNQMAEKLEKTEIMRRQLIGDVTHELRTPLTAVKGYLEGLMDGVITADPDTYQQMHTEINRLQRLVNDLQELSQVESGAFQLVFTSISPSIILETIQRNFEYQFEEKNLQLEIEIEPNLPEVLVDKDRIIQVLTNLVGNALQYTPFGGRVQIKVRREKLNLLFSVSDTGIGISAEQLPNVFNRFYRTDKSRARASGGSGIGLTIARALVKAHQGRIWVESNGEGKGSTFSFLIPIQN